MNTISIPELGALHETLAFIHKSSQGKPRPGRAAAENLLELANESWGMLSHLRANQSLLNSESVRWDNPLAVLLATSGQLDDSVWEALGRSRVRWRETVTSRDSSVREIILDGVEAVLNEAFEAPMPERSPGSKRSRGSSDRPVDQDALSSAYVDARKEFVKRYMSRRPAKLDTQEKVANAAELARSTIFAIEKGLARPRYGTIAKIAKAFGCRVEDLTS